MGRCNNRPVQQQAQDTRNVPARARFSKPPAFVNNKNQKQRRTGRNNNNNNNNASVVDRVASRIIQQHQSSSSSSVRIIRRSTPQQEVTKSYAGNVNDLDAIELSEESVERIYQLLASLGVIQSQPQSQQQPTSSALLVAQEETEEDVQEEEDEEEHSSVGSSNEEGRDSYTNTDDDHEEEGDYHADEKHIFLKQRRRQRQTPGAQGGVQYDEYDDEYDDDHLYLGRSRTSPSGDGDDDSNDDINNNMNQPEQWNTTEWEGDSTAATTTATTTTTNLHHDRFHNDPVVRYLTLHLSFSQEMACRACHALETWQGATAITAAAPTNSSCTTHNTSHRNDRAQASDWKDRLTLAMDWLALHLDDAELTSGFRRNHPQSSTHTYVAPTTTTTTTYTAIPHPSISVAPKLTHDAEFLKQARMEEQSLGFVQLGFPYADVMSVLEEQESSAAFSSSLEHVPRNSIDNDSTLRRLLSKLEHDLRSQHSLPLAEASALPADDVDTKKDVILEERMQEIEVLTAVYDADFQVQSSHDDQHHPSSSPDHMDRYKITLSTDVASLLSPFAHATNSSSNSNAMDASAELHVFLRPGYPLNETPLFMMTFPHCDVRLLRRINRELNLHAADLVGSPCIYEVTTYVSETLETIVNNFQKERRAQEFEAQQWKMRHDADAALSPKTNGLHDTATEMGRRRLARIKGEERAYDYNQQQERLALERREQQTTRLQRIQEQDRFVRFTRADEEMERRERERHDEAIRKVSRAAMLVSLNEGATTDEARAQAERAKHSYLREHGLMDDHVSEDDAGDEMNGNILKETSGENEGSTVDTDEDPTDSQTTGPTTSATPRTQAFMERLRALYDNAAEKKGAVCLESPVAKSDTSVRLPRPIAIPVGDLAGVIEDVVTVQQEQPWLVNREEARVPTLVETDAHVRVVHPDPDKLSVSLKRELEELHSRKEFAKILKQREHLPAYQVREILVHTIASNQVTVVAGETGAGKSICTPQLVLEDMIHRNLGSHANIIVTQPRRISAVGVAERIAFERLESVGETCGYSIKLERKASARTRLLFCTTGILLRRLQCDPDLASVSHVFVDEVHERDLNTDFVLIILKELLVRRPSLKLVLMSATLNSESFARYFPGSATVSIPGRSHPVREYRLEDVLQQTGYEVSENSEYVRKQSPGKGTGLSNKELQRWYPNYSPNVIQSLKIVDESIINYELLAQLLLHIIDSNEEGAILVFLPGIMEISKAMDEIRRIEKFQSSAFRIYPLHSSLSTTDQVAVFEVPPKGIRKIVLASNIAETSITIEDVVFVVDSGRVKENRRDEVKETPALVECWVSRASAKQRRGRAGRVRPGVAYHMFSSYTHDNVLQEHQLPEMLRVGLEDLVLQILTLDLGEPSRFFSSAIDPPSGLAMKNALRMLESLGAVECTWKRVADKTNEIDEGTSRCDVLDVTTELTALGFHLSSLPVDPRIGKMMIYGALFGCVESTLTIAAAMTSSKPLFVSPFDQREAANEARKAMGVEGSDHLTLLSAFTEWKRLRSVKGGRAAQTFANDKFLSRTTLFQMEDLRRHYASLLVEIGFLPKGFKLGNDGRDGANPADANAENPALLRALLCAGLYPNVIVSPRSLVSGSGNQEAGEVAFRSHSKGVVYLHPCTVSFSATKLTSRYNCFYEIVRTSKMFVRDLTPVNPLALVLFGGAIEAFPREGVITVDDWLRFRIVSKPAKKDLVPARRVALIKHLRFQLESILLQKIVSPAIEESGGRDSAAIINAIAALLSEQDADLERLNMGDGAEVVRPYILPASEGRRGRGGFTERQTGRGGRGRGRGRGRTSKSEIRVD